MIIIFEFFKRTEYNEINNEYKIKKTYYNNVLLNIRKKISSIKLEKIGGVDHIVEIDETCISRRKYNIGRLKKQIWIVGGICRETKNIFLEITNKRDSNTLKSIISSNVNPQSTIITDAWRGYNFLKNENYQHKIVNHSINFINPEDQNIHTQNVENLWKYVKKYFKKYYGNQKKNFKYFLFEYIFIKGKKKILKVF